MNAKTEASSAHKLDTVKWLGVFLLLAAGLTFFYYFSENTSVLLRVVVLLAAAGASVYIALQTAKGQGAWAFAQQSHLEVRKVVWPTRQETLQMTGVVILMVIIVALMIWAIDSILFWLVRMVTG